MARGHAGGAAPILLSTKRYTRRFKSTDLGHEPVANSNRLQRSERASPKPKKNYAVIGTQGKQADCIANYEVGRKIREIMMGISGNAISCYRGDGPFGLGFWQLR